MAKKYKVQKAMTDTASLFRNAQSLRVAYTNPNLPARIKLNGSGLSISNDNHRELLNSLMFMLHPAIKTREVLVSRFTKISQDLAAYLRNVGIEEEKERILAANDGTAVPDQRYPIAAGHVDDIVTHLLTILFPSRQMYGAAEVDPAMQDASAAFVTVMNTHGQKFAHYSEYANAISDAISFNLGVIETEWVTRFGWVVDKLEVVAEGNTVRWLDIFNTLLDFSVKPTNYSTDAQFYATVECATEYALAKMVDEQQVFGPTDLNKMWRKLVSIENGGVVSGQSYYNNYTTVWSISPSILGSGLYRYRPEVRSAASAPAGTNNHRLGAAFDVDSFLNGSQNASSTLNKLTHTNEILTITCRIRPKDYGLSDKEQLQIWRFKILNGTTIIYAAPTSLAHGLLPCGITVPREENGALESKSVAEKLIPFQDMISNIYNLYAKGVRKAVNNGLVFYDKDHMDLASMRDPSAGHVGVSSRTDDGKYVPLSSMVHKVTDNPEFNNTVRDIAQIKDMMQDVMPTNMMREMADLDRATDHQSRTVSNAASRRLFKLARTISDQAIATSGYMMTKNVILFQRAMKVVGPAGQVIEIKPDIFKNADLQIAISDGLRGIDTVSIANRISQMVQYAFQSRRVQSEVDILKLMGYLMNMEGAHFDINQFKYANPLDALPDDQKALAYQLLQAELANQQGGPGPGPGPGPSQPQPQA